MQVRQKHKKWHDGILKCDDLEKWIELYSFDIDTGTQGVLLYGKKNIGVNRYNKLIFEGGEIKIMNGTGEAYLLMILEEKIPNNIIANTKNNVNINRDKVNGSMKNGILDNNGNISCNKKGFTISTVDFNKRKIKVERALKVAAPISIAHTAAFNTSAPKGENIPNNAKKKDVLIKRIEKTIGIKKNLPQTVSSAQKSRLVSRLSFSLSNKKTKINGKMIETVKKTDIASNCRENSTKLIKYRIPKRHSIMKHNIFRME
ncbi:uncharacterized protein SCDLUD_000604 [Saccharomycodes ludwigii]|uniref:uncharacterized protein n=1 Tax=Saccharomycodes ludwigii TaxID=36035 RepID=UPI001E82E2F7|nr:hypothetical protein SCDLUD_000604 [Saccharomycodes ludwigii]KAH3903001.1 hypothetical protein SCDLUD_000604 [Saccharomycodes ludwigii]